jgi:hypothetical protein
MPIYLVVHSPRNEDESTVHAPSRMVDLAREHGHEDAQPRWLRAWSPDLHDDRMFTLWESATAEHIRDVMERFGFLSEMDAHPVCVQEWGPADVLAGESGEATS